MKSSLKGLPAIVVMGDLSDSALQEQLTTLSKFAATRREFGCVAIVGAAAVSDPEKVFVRVPDPTRIIASTYTLAPPPAKWKIAAVSREGWLVGLRDPTDTTDIKVWAERMFYNAGADDQAMRELMSQGVIGGYPDGTIRPYNPLTRAEAAKMFALAFKLEPTAGASSGFDDIPSNHWSAPFVAAIKKAGYMKGDASGKFRPNDSIRRSEIAVAIVREKFTEDKIQQLIQDESLALLQRFQRLPGSKDTPAWAVPFLAIADHAGLLPPWVRISANERATRQDLATMIYKSKFAQTGVIIDAAQGYISRSRALKVYREVANSTDELLPGESLVFYKGPPGPDQVFAEIYGVSTYKCSAPRAEERYEDTGTALYVPSQEEARVRRAGDRPIRVTGLGTRKTPDGRQSGIEIIISKEDAQKILEADAKSHFLNDWRIAVVHYPVVLETNPGEGDRDVSPEIQSIKVKVSREISRNKPEKICSITSGSGEKVEFEIEEEKLESGELVMKLNSPLKQKTTYTVELYCDNIRDSSGRPVRFAPEEKPGGLHKWSFTTGAAAPVLVKVEVKDMSIPIESQTTLKASLLDKDEKIVLGEREITFTIVDGSPEGSGLSTSNGQTGDRITVKTIDGVADVILHSGRVPGTLRVRISSKDLICDPSSVTIKVGQGGEK